MALRQTRISFIQTMEAVWISFLFADLFTFTILLLV